MEYEDDNHGRYDADRFAESSKSGLKEALNILGKVEGISVVNLSQKDIVRHKLVTRIVDAYDSFDKKQEQESKEKSKRAAAEKQQTEKEEEFTIFENSDNDFN